MQQEVHAKVVELLQAATGERDIAQRLRLLQQTQELLLRADTRPETVGSCLDYFLNLQADPNASLRRFAAHFLGRVLFFKPSQALRCIAAIAVLLADNDSIVRELALKATIRLYGRALFFLSLVGEISQFQRHSEQLLKVEAAVREFLASGSPEHPVQFQLATQWAKAVVLAQTPSPLPFRVRVPSELRGVSCLQDFPERLGQHLDLNTLQRQGEELFGFLCQLVKKPPQGRWGKAHFRPLLQCVSSIARQRPPLLPAILEDWPQLLRAATSAATVPSGQAQLPVTAADAADLRQCLCAEVQCLLTSNLTGEQRADLVELLHCAGVAGSLEDLATQAKYQQVCGVAERTAAEEITEPRVKRPRKVQLRRAWVTNGSGLEVAEDDGAFDGDAVVSGESETACRRFEDYFGLPSQREPAGHVAGPALLASRIGNNAELARIALTSLNSLSMKRSLLRDRAHERAVMFSDPPLCDADGRAKAGAGAGPDAPELEVFLAVDPSVLAAGNADEAIGRDPRRALLPAFGLPGALQLRGKLQGEADGDLLLPTDGASARMPAELAARDGLQLQIFEEVLEAQRRMDRSALRSGLSERQAAGFERLSRQVALHIATGMKMALSPSLQRKMCQAFMMSAFDQLKASLESSKSGTTTGQSPPAGGSAAMGKLIELFYAKFTTDVARWQDASQQSGKVAAKTPLRDILEGTRGFVKPHVIFTYAELFQMFNDEFRRRELPRRELRAFLNEIPVVPLSAFTMLEAQCQQSPARKMALLTVLSLIERKPACRWQGLQLLFKLAYSGGDDSSVRFDTIRLIINKVYSAGPRSPVRWQLPHLGDAEAAPLLADGESEEPSLGWELSDDEFLPLQQLKGRCVEDIATLMLRSMAPGSAKFPFLVNVPPRVEQLRKDLFKGAVCVAKDRVWLYLALCIKRPVLLHELVETFTKCDAEVKEHLINSIEEAIKYIPASEKELLVLVQKATPETERLVLKVLHILMQTSQGKDGQAKEGLSVAYGEAVTRLYGITQNPRLLVPVFDLLDRRHLLDFLPAILQLEAEQVADAFRLLVRSKMPPLSISELLTELHHMNNPTENIVPVKCSMQALNTVFGMRDQFDPKVYGIVIQALVEEPGPLPTLFMRTVIQVVKELPRLSDFVVMEILPRLVRQEVWGDENMWRGFMIVLQHTFASQSGGAARVLAMLPMSQLEDVLVQHPEWKAQLREFVARQPLGAVPPHVRQLLQ